MENLLKVEHHHNIEKADSSKQDNIKLMQNIKQQKSREKHLCMLPVTKSTIIMVPADKCNKEYAEWYRINRMHIKQ